MGGVCTVEPLPGGHRNRVLRSRGLAQDRVFKTTRRSAEALEWLGPVQGAARAAGFEVPALIRSHNGALAEAGWTCEPLLRCRAFDATGMTGLASRLARFHAATRGLAQRPGFRAAAALCGATRGGDVDLGLMPAALVRACRAAWQALRALPCAAVHGDLTPANLLWSDAGAPILLDWDEARLDAVVFDTAQIAPVAPAVARALMAWKIATSWQIEPAHARALARRFLRAQA